MTFSFRYALLYLLYSVLRTVPEYVCMIRSYAINRVEFDHHLPLTYANTYVIGPLSSSEYPSIPTSEAKEGLGKIPFIQTTFVVYLHKFLIFFIKISHSLLPLLTSSPFVLVISCSIETTQMLYLD